MSIATLAAHEQRSLEVAMSEYCAELETRAAALEPEAQRLLAIYSNEAQFCLRLISPLISHRQRLLEVGSGSGILCAFLHKEGFKIVGLEPTETGFGHMAALSAFVRSSPTISETLDLRDWSIERLEEEDPSEFDFIFSFHVLEHVEDLESLFGSMSRVLSPDGEMFHLCPNYIVPYEPHFGVPIVYMFPQMTERVFPKKVAAARELWESLNYVTAFDLVRLCRDNGLTCSFENGIMAKYTMRAAVDSEFRSRHKGVIGWLTKVLNANFLKRLANSAPPKFSTPMAIRIHHARAKKNRIIAS